MSRLNTFTPTPGQEIKTTRPCPICHGHSGQFLHRMEFALPEESPLPDRYDLVVCDECETCFADSSVGEEAYKAHYQNFSKYEDPSVATGGGDDSADLERLRQLAEFISDRYPRDIRILDIGCGNGGLLTELQKQGFRFLAGMDPSGRCAEAVRGKGFEAEVATLPLIKRALDRMPSRHFDLIILSHVLEHVYDIKEAMQSLASVCSPQAQCYIEIPDPTRYSVDGFPPYYFFDSEHINHLTPASLARIAADNGFEDFMIGRKEIILQNGCAYPAIYGVIGVSGTGGNGGPLGDALASYVEQSELALQSIWHSVQSVFKSSTGVAIWGAGSLAQRLVAASFFPRDKLKAVVDRDKNKQGLRFAGVVVEDPESGISKLASGDAVLCMAAIAGQAIELDYKSMGFRLPFFRLN